jgi:hypothetical protein
MLIIGAGGGYRLEIKAGPPQYHSAGRAADLFATVALNSVHGRRANSSVIASKPGCNDAHNAFANSPLPPTFLHVPFDGYSIVGCNDPKCNYNTGCFSRWPPHKPVFLGYWSK